MVSKKEVVIEGNVESTFMDSVKATVIDYDTAIFLLKNTNLSGSNYALKYSVMFTPDQNVSTIDWYTKVSAQTLSAGGWATHKLTDPWEAAKFQVINSTSGEVAQVKGWINRRG